VTTVTKLSERRKFIETARYPVLRTTNTAAS